MTEAPLFIQTFDLASWLLRQLPAESPLTPRLHREGLALLDAVVLALRGQDTDARLAQADEAATLLRIHLRLAVQIEQLTPRQMLFLTGELDSIGRQLGGWRKKRTPDTRARRDR